MKHLIFLLVLSSCSVVLNHETRINKEDAYEDLMVVYEFDLLGQIKPVSKHFIFSDDVAYINGKFYPCELIKKTRTTKVWKVGWSSYVFEMDKKQLHRQYLLDDDHKSPLVHLATYVIY